MCVRVCMRVYIYIFAYIYIYICVHVCVRLYIYVCIYMYPYIADRKAAINMIGLLWIATGVVAFIQLSFSLASSPWQTHLTRRPRLQRTILHTTIWYTTVYQVPLAPSQSWHCLPYLRLPHQHLDGSVRHAHIMFYHYKKASFAATQTFLADIWTSSADVMASCLLGLFCWCIGLFCGYKGLFCGYVGSFADIHSSFADM